MRRTWGGWIALLGLVAGCAHAPSMTIPADEAGSPRPRLALLPLENLTGRADAGDAFTRILFVELVRKGGFEVVEMGQVETAMDSLRLRSGTSLSSEELRALGTRLSAGSVMVGTLLESSVQQTPEGQVPSIGVALKLLDPQTARVEWAQMAFRSGDDHETFFGWGREENPQRLAAALATQVLADLKVPGAPGSTR